MRKRVLFFVPVAVGAMSLFWNATHADDARVSGAAQLQNAPAAVKAGEAQPVLRTQQFENGELQMKEVAADRLETFLQDLHKRRDYDFSQHEGQPGPDHAYLTTWIKKTMDELLDRGYYVDKYGDLHRPGAIVPTR